MGTRSADRRPAGWQFSAYLRRWLVPARSVALCVGTEMGDVCALAEKSLPGTDRQAVRARPSLIIASTGMGRVGPFRAQRCQVRR